VADKDCRENIIASAVPLFAAKGLNGVSVRDLARAAGVNLSMISYYFGGKEGLYAAVLTEQFAVLGKLEEIEQMEIDTLQKLELYVRATVSRYRKSPFLLRFYTSELTNPTACFETIVKPAIKKSCRCFWRPLATVLPTKGSGRTLILPIPCWPWPG